ncbi:uncharacterized protein TNCV_1348841 [Trichonephila clavipes]|nr:uncharacterized protein TNCV_1348841 [Trichonephila clavipes]
MRQIGKGFAGAFKLSSTLNLPRLTKTAYKNQEAKLLKVVQEVAEESMIKAATVEKKQNLSSDIVKCSISVDGTWQRRGYTSMNGSVAAISVDTGKMLDIEVMSSYCPTCKRLQTMQRNFEYESSKADHKCQCNFTGSSSKTEIVGASRIFLRSEKNRRLQYTQYYGDGDSKAFMSVKDTYGINSGTKFECIGHVQKRVGSRLRKLKTKTKGLSGKGKLTDNFIDRLQSYYGIAVRINVGNLNAMQQNVIAALYHCASSDKKPMHVIGVRVYCVCSNLTHKFAKKRTKETSEESFLRKKKSLREKTERCSTSKKRVTFNRQYHESYLKYGFVGTGDSHKQKQLCIVCGIPFSNEAMKSSILLRHLSAKQRRIKVANRIAKANKPFTIGEKLILPAIKDMDHVLLGEAAVETVAHVPFCSLTLSFGALRE